MPMGKPFICVWKKFLTSEIHIFSSSKAYLVWNLIFVIK